MARGGLEATHIWKVFDPEGKKEITRDSFLKTLEKLDPKLATNKQMLQNLLPAFDKRRLGVIRFEDFIKALEQFAEEGGLSDESETDRKGDSDDVESVYGTDEESADENKEAENLLELEECFKDFDEGNKGYLTAEQFRALFRDWTFSNTPPEAVSEEEVDKQITALWHELGKGKDSTITWKELVQALQDDSAASRQTPGGTGTLPSSPILHAMSGATVGAMVGATAGATLGVPAGASVGTKIPSGPPTPRGSRFWSSTLYSEPSSRQIDPAVRKLRSGLRKLKQRNLTLLEMEAINELCLVPSLKSVPLDFFARIVDQVVERKKDLPEPTSGKDKGRRASVADDPTAIKETARVLTEKNNKLQKALENLKKQTTLVDGENAKLLSQLSYMEEKFKASEKQKEQQIKYLEDSRKNYQEDAAELSKKWTALLREHNELKENFRALQSKERAHLAQIKKLKESLEKAESQLGKRRSPSFIRSQSFASPTPVTPEREIKESEELKKYIKSMEAEKEAQLRLIGSLNASLRERSPLKVVDESVSEQLDLEHLRSQVSKLNDELREVKEQHIRDLTNKESDLALKQALIDQLRSEVRQLQRAGMAPETPPPPVAEPVISVKAAEQIKEKLEKIIAERETNILKLSRELDASRADLTKAQQDTSRKLELLKAQILVLEQKLSILQSEADAQQKERERLEDELRRAQDELRQKEEEIKITILETKTTISQQKVKVADHRGNIQSSSPVAVDSFYQLDDFRGRPGLHRQPEEVTPLLEKKKDTCCCGCCPASCCTIL